MKILSVMTLNTAKKLISLEENQSLVLPSSRKNCNEPMPTTIKIKPKKSMLRWTILVCLINVNVSAMPRMQMGRLM